MSSVDETLRRLEELIRDRRFAPLESDTIEIKPVPLTGGDWTERKKSVCAFLNTRGGILILGVRESKGDRGRFYEFTGWREEAENSLKDFGKAFKDRQGRDLPLSEYLPRLEPRPFLDGQIALYYVEELPAELKFVFLDGKAYKRVGTRDQTIHEREIEAQEEYREEAIQARELLPVEGTDLSSIDLDKLNDYINKLNGLQKIETLKTSTQEAESFLTRKCFLKDGKATLLGMLVCGKYVRDVLGFRAQVHAYVDATGATDRRIVVDKHDFCDNVLPLMESSYRYVLRNIHVGISAEGGGRAVPEYPEELLRETVNNALSHRDYSINKQSIIAIEPGKSFSIRNPGTFRKHLLIETEETDILLRRIIPDAKPRNPKLADVLRLYNKWEGRGIGMSTMVNLCLENRIDLPYYTLSSQEVELVIRSGKLLDEGMERFFQDYDGYITSKTNGRDLTEPQKLVLSYLIKSEEENAKHRYTILLTPDNNHFAELGFLERSGLISTHRAGTAFQPVYVVDTTLTRYDPLPYLRENFGPLFDAIAPFHKEVLAMVERCNRFSKARLASAKQTSYSLWYSKGHRRVDDIKAFDNFYRRVRSSFNFLLDKGFLVKSGKLFEVNTNFRKNQLF